MPETSSSLVHRVTACAILAAAAWFGLRVPLPQPPGLAAPGSVFSADHALKHVRAIATEPHPAGSPAAAAVRDYILSALGALGIPAEVQRSTGLYQRGSIVMAGHVENVVARLKGTGGGRALLLCGHYDSVRTGPGAADDGHAVGVLLETAQALKAGAPLKNDVIFLFDVEETGMTGADAFAREHPWRKDVDVVLNFEARGTRGPVFMFQTSNGNGTLIRELAAAAPYPVATSLAYEIYKRLPNDTDMSVFRKYGYAGYDFAFIGNVLDYHTPADDVAHLNPATVQHAGSYALELARRLGNADLPALHRPQGDAVYFSAGGLFFHYPAALAGALTIAALALLWWVLGTLRQRGTITLKGAALGAGICAALIAVAGSAMGWVWKGICLLHPGYLSLPQNDLYARNWYIVAYFALAFALFLGGLALARRYTTAESFAAGALVVGAVALIAVNIFLPGGTYILLWPLVGGTLALCAGGKRPVLAAALCIPAFVLLFQFACFGFTGLMMGAAGVSSGLFLLTLTLSATPVVAIVGPSYRGWLYAVGAIFVAALAGGAWANQFDAAQPIENDMAYIADVNTGESWWVSRTNGSDPWLRQFLGRSPEIVQNLYDMKGEAQRAPAPRIDVAAPEVRMTGEVPGRGKRRIALKIVSRRSAVMFVVQMLNPRDLIRGSVEGLPWYKNGGLTRRAGWTGLPTVYYTAPGPEGAALEFEIRAGARLKLRVFEPVQGLPRGPEFHWLWRGPGLLAAPAHPFNDDTVTVQSFEF